MEFINRNSEAFEKYNVWKINNLDVTESECWEHRPEFIDMHFITWTSFIDAIRKSSIQLDAYEKDKATQAKSIVCELVDYLGRPKLAIIRSWPVMLLRNTAFRF